jgi:hypothetical protein
MKLARFSDRCSICLIGCRPTKMRPFAPADLPRKPHAPREQNPLLTSVGHGDCHKCNPQIWVSTIAALAFAIRFKGRVDGAIGGGAKRSLYSIRREYHADGSTQVLAERLSAEPALGRRRHRACIGTIGSIERTIDTAGICNQLACKFIHTKSFRYRTRSHNSWPDNRWHHHNKTTSERFLRSQRTQWAH